MEAIVDVVGFKGNVRGDTEHDIGQKEKIPSNKKLTGLLPEFEFSDLRYGITETVNWFRSPPAL